VAECAKNYQRETKARTTPVAKTRDEEGEHRGFLFSARSSSRRPARRCFLANLAAISTRRRERPTRTARGTNRSAVTCSKRCPGHSRRARGWCANAIPACRRCNQHGHELPARNPPASPSTPNRDDGCVGEARSAMRQRQGPAAAGQADASSGAGDYLAKASTNRAGRRWKTMALVWVICPDRRAVGDHT
jgi:hypothetical protein